MEIELTEEEEKAIASLRRLGKRWPRTLLLFGGSGSAISVRKPDENGSYGIQREVDTVAGFPNDGGDGGDVF